MPNYNFKINKHSLFAFVFICMCNFVFGQNYTPKQIDSLNKLAKAERIKGNFKNSLQMYLLNVKESERLKYSKGITESHFGAGFTYNSLENHSKAIEHFAIAEQQKYTQTNHAMQSEINRFIGGSYTELGLYKKAIEKQNKAIALAEKEGGPNLNLRKAMNYIDMAVAYDRMGNQDSTHSKLTKAFYYVKRSVDFTDKFTKVEKDGFAAATASNIGAFWSDHNNVDSAQYYFQQALALNKGVNNNSANFFVYNQLGDFYLKQKKYFDAIESYKKAIELSKESKNHLRNKNPYKGISEAYRLLGDEEKSVAYYQEFIKINDSVNASEKKGVDTAFKKILNEEKTLQEQTKSRLYWVIGGILLLATLLSFFAYWFYQNMRRKKDNTISNSEDRLAQKREIIEQKEKEAEELKVKVNESFEEVVKLAKENSSEFFSRFQETYPEFRSKLLQINPDLKITELTLCAYIYLGFNTKDIAEYTFKAEKTIRNNKHNIRKRLDVPAKSDFTIWLHNQTNS